MIVGARIYKVGREQELRLSPKTAAAKVFVTLMRTDNGTAEIFGSELAPRRRYAITRSVAVFSWSGCELEVEGECHAYVAEETPMVSYLNVHVVLEARRAKAKQDKTLYGPKVLVAGGCDVGKSTLARILLSYGARVGSAVTFADIDVGQNSITVPGALAAVHVSKPFDVETGLGAGKAPLTYFFGHTSPSANLTLYRKQMDAVAAELSRHLASKPEARASGIVVNTCGWTDGDGYELLLHAIRAFKIDVVLVIDHERLFNDIKTTAFPQQVECIKLRKSGGVLARDPETRRNDRQRAVREYFCGANNELHPHNTVMNFGVMKVCKVGGGPQAPSTALPIGSERLVDETAVTVIEPNKELLHTLCALSYGGEPESALAANVAGFVLVTHVDEEAKKCHLLTPCAGRLPSVLFLVSDIQSIGVEK